MTSLPVSSWVIVNDACSLIDLRKGRLLHVLLKLPFRFVIPLPIRSELKDFTDQEWQLLDDSGMETFDLPSEQVSKVLETKRIYSKLSVNDCFCLVSTQCFDNGILLTGDRLLRKVATEAGVTVHGVLWIIDNLREANVCSHELLISALERWKADKAVFVPLPEIECRLNLLRRG